MARNLITAETRLVGGMGSTYVDATGSPAVVTGLEAFMFVVREDTTITAITGENASGNTVDVLAQMNLTVSITLKKGERFYADLDTVITEIELATGSIISH